MICLYVLFVFFFKQKTAYERRISDWSSDVCSSDRVLVAAVRMFNERGFHATSLDDVAASLGVTKPVIYHYLGNKDQVVFECVRIGLAQLREAAEAARAAPGTGLDRLKAFLRRYAVINMEAFGKCIIRTGDEVLSTESRQNFRAPQKEIDRTLTNTNKHTNTDEQ